MNQPTTRIELDATDETLAQGLSAELHDPMWLLARQWQMGEFRGEDVGTPVLLRAVVHSDVPHELQIGGQALTLTGSRDPIESLIEREAAAEPDLALRLAGGALFVELLELEGLAAMGDRCASAFPFPASLPGDGAASNTPDEAAARPDGEALLAAFTESASALALVLDVTPAQEERFGGVVARWRDWYAPRRGIGGGLAWSDDDWAHNATLRTRGGAELTAPDHDGGALDWRAFDLRHVADSLPVMAEPVERVPMPLQIPGTGALRFWEMEDSQVDLGALAAGSTEIARALLSEFALLWGHDWFSVPLELPSGGWVSVRDVVVQDTFGVVTPLVPAPVDGGFGLWRQTGAGPAATGWWVGDGATVGPGGVIERLDILRDEGANMLWASETRLVDDFGLPLAGPAATSPPVAPLAPEPTGWRYRPFMPPPPGLVPLVTIDGLVRPGSLALGTGEPPVLRTPVARTLSLRADRLYTEGLTLLRQWEVARRRDGQLVAWIARRRQSGAPDSGQSIAFDLLERS